MYKIRGYYFSQDLQLQVLLEITKFHLHKSVPGNTVYLVDSASWKFPTVSMLAAKQHQIVGAVLQKFLVALLGLRTEYKKTPIFVAKMICGTGKDWL